MNKEDSGENLLVNFNYTMSIVSLYMTRKMRNNRNNFDLQNTIYIEHEVEKRKRKSNLHGCDY